MSVWDQAEAAEKQQLSVWDQAEAAETPREGLVSRAAKGLWNATVGNVVNAVRTKSNVGLALRDAEAWSQIRLAREAGEPEPSLEEAYRRADAAIAERTAKPAFGIPGILGQVAAGNVLPVAPAETLPEKAVDVATGIGGFAARLAATKRLLPGAPDVVTWEVAEEAAGAAPGTGALQAGMIGAAGAVTRGLPAATIGQRALRRTAKAGIESAGFGGLAAAQGASTEEIITQALIPFAFAGWDAVKRLPAEARRAEMKKKLDAAAKAEKLNPDIVEAAKKVVDSGAVDEGPASVEKPQPQRAAPEPATPGQPPELSTRNVDTAIAREQLGLQPRTPPEPGRIAENQRMWAEQAVTAAEVQQIAEGFAANPRPLTTAEEMGFRDRINQLLAEHKALSDKADALPEGRNDTKEAIRARADVADAAEKLIQVAEAAGSQWAHTGQARQNITALLNDETSEIAMTRRAENRKGDKLTPSEKADVEVKTKKVREATKAQEEARRPATKKRAEKAIRRRGTRYARMTEAEKDAEIDSILREAGENPTSEQLYALAMNLGSRPGINNLGDIVTRLQGQIPELTEFNLATSIVDAMTRSRREVGVVEAALRALRGEARRNDAYQTAIDDALYHLRRGTLPESKRKLRKPDTNTNEALREVLTYYRHLLRTSEPAQREAIQKQIDALQARLANRDFESRSATGQPPLSSVVMDLMARRAELSRQVAKERKAYRGYTDGVARLNRQIAALEHRVDAGAYQKMPRPGVRRVPEEVDALRARKRELETKLANMRRTRQSLEDLKGKIRTVNQHINEGTLPDKVPAIAESPVDPLKAKLQEVLKQSQGVLAKTNPARRAALEEQLAILKTRLASKDYAPRPTPAEPPIRNPEVERLSYKVAQARHELHRRMAAFNPWYKGWEEHPVRAGAALLGKTLREIQAWKSSFDIPLLRQGGISTRSHPIRTLRRLPAAIRWFFDAEESARINDRLINGEDSWYYHRAGLRFTDPEGGLNQREELFAASFLEGRKYLGAGIRASNRAFSTLLNVIRADSFDALSRGFGAESMAEAKAIAAYVNVTTGQGSMAGLEKYAPTLNGYMWSPRFTMSRWQYRLGVPLWKAPTWHTRRIIAQEYGRYIAGLAVTGWLYEKVFGGKLNQDHTSADFGKIVIGNTRLDPMSGLAQVSVVINRLTSGKYTTASGEEIPMYGPDRPIWGSTRSEAAMRYIRLKANYGIGVVWSLFDHKDAIGQPTTLLREAKKGVLPMAWEDLLKVVEDQGVPKGLAIQALSTLSEGVQVYEEKAAPRQPAKRSLRRRQ